MSKNIDKNKNVLNSLVVTKDEKTYLNLFICHLNVGLIFVKNVYYIFKKNKDFCKIDKYIFIKTISFDLKYTTIINVLYLCNDC